MRAKRKGKRWANLITLFFIFQHTIDTVLKIIHFHFNTDQNVKAHSLPGN